MGKLVYVISKFHRNEYAAWRDGERVKFQSKVLSKCKHLTSWIRVDNYLIRFEELLWYAGMKLEEIPHTCEILELKNLFELHIKDKPILELCQEIEDYGNNNKMRWFYARTRCLTKREIDKLSDEFIEQELNNKDK